MSTPHTRARDFLCALLALGAASCRSAGHLPVSRDFVPMVDAYGDAAELMATLDAAGTPPWLVLVGGADQVEDLVAARAASPVAATIIDLSVVEPLQRDAVVARALEAALEQESAVLLDADGANARALRGTSRDITRVTLDARRNVVAAEAQGSMVQGPVAEGGRP